MEGLESGNNIWNNLRNKTWGIEDVVDDKGTRIASRSSSGWCLFRFGELEEEEVLEMKKVAIISTTLLDVKTEESGQGGGQKMAEKAYVLIETQVGTTKEAVEAIRALEGVVSADMVTGPYDVIATIEGQTLSEIGDLVTTRLHLMSGVSRTVICLAVERLV